MGNEFNRAKRTRPFYSNSLGPFLRAFTVGVYSSAFELLDEQNYILLNIYKIGRCGTIEHVA